ncbi:hypothetical protein PR048_012708 [Dryococelus australis]|uniref:Uncharacterized protein n=1 Tax=Dryococelus australis TaxID=614101 RepID=A0ABQ9HQ69_9NEOP|nr:hypothetical protein PR048_012708 [Dryococelus australis]
MCLFMIGNLYVIKAPGQLHFQFAPSKRVVLTNTKNSTIVIKGEVNNRVDIGTSKPFVKIGKWITSNQSRAATIPSASESSKN